MVRFILFLGLLAFLSIQVRGECCTKADPELGSAFCTVYNMLAGKEKAEVRTYLGENCDGDVDDAIKMMEKRKPNFIRFGRSEEDNPNFLRFGRPSAQAIKNMYRLGKKDEGSIKALYRLGKRDQESIKALYRLGKKGGKPTFLRFGKRSDSNPNFLRFGKDDPNFLRFGKASKPTFLRFGRKPNFIRFGRSDTDEKRKPNFLRFG